MASKTKAQIEADGKAKLRQRIMDIAIGASRGCDLACCEVEGNFYTAMDPEEFFGLIRAIDRVFFDLDRNETRLVFEVWNLHKFATIDTAVEHLWEYGVRA